MCNMKMFFLIYFIVIVCFLLSGVIMPIIISSSNISLSTIIGLISTIFLFIFSIFYFLFINNSNKGK